MEEEEYVLVFAVKKLQLQKIQLLAFLVNFEVYIQQLDTEKQRKEKTLSVCVSLCETNCVCVCVYGEKGTLQNTTARNVLTYQRNS